MLSKGDRLSLFISYVERSCCTGQCMLWAQTDINAYERLETLVSERGVGKPGASFMDTKSVAQNDILLAQYDSSSFLYRAQVSYHYGVSRLCFAICRISIAFDYGLLWLPVSSSHSCLVTESTRHK